MSDLEFPLLTSPASNRDDFLARFQELVESEFSELVAVAPFVDGKLMENLLRGFLYNERRLLIVTRYRKLYKEQKKGVRRAVERLKEAAAKDPTLAARVTWHVNPRLHAKFVIRDWECVLFGSQNFTYSALKQNYELGAFISPLGDFRAELESFLDEIIRNKSNTLFP